MREALRERCSRDILFYVNSFVWQFNPRKKGLEVGPFITWEFQDDALTYIIEHIKEDADLLIEKSREMGASWICLIVMDWLSLFRRRQTFLCISHSEQAVDRKEDPGSLFWKIAFMHRYLPTWLVGKRPRKFKMRFYYPQTHSSITGAATSERSGVGGRATAVFLDEFSKQKDDAAISGQTADVGCRIFNGTHYGIGTEFFKLTQRPDMHKLVMHWSQHPDKSPGLYEVKNGKVQPHDLGYAYAADHQFVYDGSPVGGPYPGLRSPWYDRECIRRASSRDVAMHLDINPEGSVSQFFDPIMIRQLQETYCVEPYWQGDLEYDRDLARPLALVPSPSGSLKLWLQPDARGKVAPGRFGMGADPASGQGATPSCASIINAQTGEKVAEYANAFITPEDFAVLAVSLAWLFKDQDGQGARFCWESQGAGSALGKKVMELGYRHVYWRTAEVEGLAPEVSAKAGWVPMPNNTRVLLEEYRGALNRREVVNRSHRALEECLRFQYDRVHQVKHGSVDLKDDPAHARTNHGDRVIADALAWKMVRELGAGARTVNAEQTLSVLSLAGRRALVENQSKQRSWA